MYFKIINISTTDSLKILIFISKGINKKQK